MPAATIRGQVVSDDTGDAIRNARVGIGDGPDAPAALTDAEGRFALVEVPADRPPTLSAAKTGYAKTSIPAAADVKIRLTKAGAITGRVLDDLGEPIPLMTVVAERVVRKPGGVTFERTAAVETDDTGEYRLFGLQAGEFVVGAAGGRMPTATSPPPASSDRPAHNYYPHAQKPEEGQRIPIAPSEEKPGIDLTVAMPPAGPPPAAIPPTSVRMSESGIIRGRLLRGDGLPVRRGRVELASGENLFSPYATSTDDAGGYEFRNLRPGTYLVRGAAPGASTIAFGQRNPSDRGELITLTPGSARDHVDMTLPRPGVISGRILDEYGDPMENANVRVERIVFSNGRRRLVGAGLTARQTNDLGRYRISGLPPGRYVVSAVVGETVPGYETADWPGYARTFFPGTSNPAEAQTIDIGPAQDALTSDFALVRGHIARMTGTGIRPTAGRCRGGCHSRRATARRRSPPRRFRYGRTGMAASRSSASRPASTSCRRQRRAPVSRRRASSAHNSSPLMASISPGSMCTSRRDRRSKGGWSSRVLSRRRIPSSVSRRFPWIRILSPSSTTRPLVQTSTTTGRSR